MTYIKMQPFLVKPSTQIDTANSVENKEKPQNSLLEKMIKRENDIIGLKKLHQMVKRLKTSPNQYLNKMESQIIAKAALIVTKVSTNRIPEYLQKLENLFNDYEKYKKANHWQAQSSYEELDYLRQYLWKNGEGRYQPEQVSFYFDRVIDHQIDYLNEKSKFVGNCNELTLLFNILAIRLGIDIKTISTFDHQFSAYQGKKIENTAANGIYHRNYSYYLETSPFEGIASFCFNLGAAHYQKKEYDLALPYYLKAIEINPQNAYFHYNLGAVYQELKQYDKAKAAYEKSLELNPQLNQAKEDLKEIELRRR